MRTSILIECEIDIGSVDEVVDQAASGWRGIKIQYLYRVRIDTAGRQHVKLRSQADKVRDSGDGTPTEKRIANINRCG